MIPFQSLFDLDTLPAGGAVEALANLGMASQSAVCFRATRPRRWFPWWRQRSGWTHWYPYTGQPIALVWADLWER